MWWKKLVDDTLKSPNGKWSRKSLTTFISFGFALILGTYIVVSDYIIDREINKYAIEVFYGFLILGGGTLGLTVYDKIKNKNNESLVEE
jgi:hypothetical protein